jgi:hypothetical protein
MSQPIENDQDPESAALGEQGAGMEPESNRRSPRPLSPVQPIPT